MRTQLTILGLSLFLMIGFPLASQAQPVVPACNMNCGMPTICGLLDSNCINQNAQIALCQTEQASCQAKFMLYDAYLTQMGLGVGL